jgi:hypothetical protein
MSKLIFNFKDVSDGPFYPPFYKIL